MTPCQPPIATPREVAFDEEIERLWYALDNSTKKKIIDGFTLYESPDDPDYIEGAIFFSIPAADSACELYLMLEHLAASVENWQKGSDRR